MMPSWNTMGPQGFPGNNYPQMMWPNSQGPQGMGNPMMGPYGMGPGGPMGPGQMMYPDYQQQYMYPQQMMGQYNMNNQSQMMTQQQGKQQGGNTGSAKQPANHPPEPSDPPPPKEPPGLPKQPPLPPKDESKVSKTGDSSGEWWHAEMEEVKGQGSLVEELKRLVCANWFLGLKASQQKECWQHTKQELLASAAGDPSSNTSKSAAVGEFSWQSSVTTGNQMKTNSTSSGQTLPTFVDQKVAPNWDATSGENPHQALARYEEQLSKLKQKGQVFDKQYTDWHKQFDEWKEKHKNHPNKAKFAQYEKQWETWQQQLMTQKMQNDANVNSLNENLKKIKKVIADGSQASSSSQQLPTKSPAQPKNSATTAQNNLSQQSNFFQGANNMQYGQPGFVNQGQVAPNMPGYGFNPPTPNFNQSSMPNQPNLGNHQQGPWAPGPNQPRQWGPGPNQPGPWGPGLNQMGPWGPGNMQQGPQQRPQAPNSNQKRPLTTNTNQQGTPGPTGNQQKPTGPPVKQQGSSNNQQGTSGPAKIQESGPAKKNPQGSQAPVTSQQGIQGPAKNLQGPTGNQQGNWAANNPPQGPPANNQQMSWGPGSNQQQGWSSGNNQKGPGNHQESWGPRMQGPLGSGVNQQQPPGPNNNQQRPPAPLNQQRLWRPGTSQAGQWGPSNNQMRPWGPRNKQQGPRGPHGNQQRPRDPLSNNQQRPWGPKNKAGPWAPVNNQPAPPGPVNNQSESFGPNNSLHGPWGPDGDHMNESGKPWEQNSGQQASWEDGGGGGDGYSGANQSQWGGNENEQGGPNQQGPWSGAQEQEEYGEEGGENWNNDQDNYDDDQQWNEFEDSGYDNDKSWGQPYNQSKFDGPPKKRPTTYDIYGNVVEPEPNNKPTPGPNKRSFNSRMPFNQSQRPRGPKPINDRENWQSSTRPNHPGNFRPNMPGGPRMPMRNRFRPPGPQGGPNMQGDFRPRIRIERNRAPGPKGSPIGFRPRAPGAMEPPFRGQKPNQDFRPRMAIDRLSGPRKPGANSGGFRHRMQPDSQSGSRMNFNDPDNFRPRMPKMDQNGPRGFRLRMPMGSLHGPRPPTSGPVGLDGGFRPRAPVDPQKKPSVNSPGSSIGFRQRMPFGVDSSPPASHSVDWQQNLNRNDRKIQTPDSRNQRKLPLTSTPSDKVSGPHSTKAPPSHESGKPVPPATQNIISRDRDWSSSKEDAALKKPQEEDRFSSLATGNVAKRHGFTSATEQDIPPPVFSIKPPVLKDVAASNVSSMHDSDTSNETAKPQDVSKPATSLTVTSKADTFPVMSDPLHVEAYLNKEDNKMATEASNKTKNQKSNGDRSSKKPAPAQDVVGETTQFKASEMTQDVLPPLKDVGDELHHQPDSKSLATDQLGVVLDKDSDVKHPEDTTPDDEQSVTAGRDVLKPGADKINLLQSGSNDENLASLMNFPPVNFDFTADDTYATFFQPSEAMMEVSSTDPTSLDTEDLLGKSSVPEDNALSLLPKVYGDDLCRASSSSSDEKNSAKPEITLPAVEQRAADEVIEEETIIEYEEIENKSISIKEPAEANVANIEELTASEQKKDETLERINDDEESQKATEEVEEQVQEETQKQPTAIVEDTVCEEAGNEVSDDVDQTEKKPPLNLLSESPEPDSTDPGLPGSPSGGVLPPDHFKDGICPQGPPPENFKPPPRSATVQKPLNAGSSMPQAPPMPGGPSKSKADDQMSLRSSKRAKLDEIADAKGQKVHSMYDKFGNLVGTVDGKDPPKSSRDKLSSRGRKGGRDEKTYIPHLPPPMPRPSNSSSEKRDSNRKSPRHDDGRPRGGRNEPFGVGQRFRPRTPNSDMRPQGTIDGLRSRMSQEGRDFPKRPRLSQPDRRRHSDEFPDDPIPDMRAKERDLQLLQGILLASRGGQQRMPLRPQRAPFDDLPPPLRFSEHGSRLWQDSQPQRLPRGPRPRFGGPRPRMPSQRNRGSRW
ncbi:uncharacterized protein LOC143461613 [Clavelina lepadiformis]|uniref:uncharacterized protein LOC143461613 n=1 Tax=Clavelina lepadiformis TaxID=159417 RepID=UPI0040420EE2